MQIKVQPRFKEKLDLTPLIDIIFILVIFFMYASTFTDVTTIEVESPTSNHTKVISIQKSFVLFIDEENNVYFKKKEDKDHRAYQSLLELEKDLEFYLESNPKEGFKPTVYLKVDRSADFSKVIAVWNCAKNMGISKVSFGIDSKNKKKL